MSCRWSCLQLNTERLFCTQWKPFPASIANEEGAKLFIQSFLRLFDRARLTENEETCLRACMLLSIPPPPLGVLSLRASIRDNLALCSLYDLIGAMVDLAQGNTYLGGGSMREQAGGGWNTHSWAGSGHLYLTLFPVFAPSYEVCMWRPGLVHLIYPSGGYTPGVNHLAYPNAAFLAEYCIWSWPSTRFLLHGTRTSVNSSLIYIEHTSSEFEGQCWPHSHQGHLSSPTRPWVQEASTTGREQTSPTFSASAVRSNKYRNKCRRWRRM